MPPQTRPRLSLLETVFRPNLLATKEPLMTLSGQTSRVQARPGSSLDLNENSFGSCLSRHDSMYSGDAGVHVNPSSEDDNDNADDDNDDNDNDNDDNDDDGRGGFHEHRFDGRDDATLGFAETQSLHRYPTPCIQRQLREQVAVSRGLSERCGRNIVMANGSAELIDLIIRTTCVPGQDAIVLTPPTYPLYNDRAVVNDIAVLESPLRFFDNDFHLDVPGMLSLLSRNDRVKLVFIPTPGNPTGSIVPLSQIEQLLKAPDLRALVVVDEAYIGFAPDHCQSAISLLDKYPNLVVLQTLSKSHGLAGARFGMAFAHEMVVEMIHRVQLPFAVPTPTLAIASKSLSSVFLKGHRAAMARFVQCRRKLVEDLRHNPELAALGVGPPIGGCHGNFVLLPIWSSAPSWASWSPSSVSSFSLSPLSLVSSASSASSMSSMWSSPSPQPPASPSEPFRDNGRAMRARDILRSEFDTSVSFVGHMDGCRGCLRITVGTPEENRKLVQDLITIFGRFRN